MSFYNMMFGENPLGEVLLATLGLASRDVPRFRDCYLDGDQIVIYTRTGGGNRDYYDVDTTEEGYEPLNSYDPTVGELTNHVMYGHPNFVRDEDDDFDCTYASWYFSFPEEFKDELEQLAQGVETIKPSEKWQALFDTIDGKMNP